MNDDRRAVRQPCGIRLALQDLREAFSEGGGEGRSGTPRVNGGKEGPARVIDTIFDGRSVALPRVSPFAMREEVLERTWNQRVAPSVSLHAERGVLRSVAPFE